MRIAWNTNLDRAVFERALEALVLGTDALRLTFSEQDGAACQRVWPSIPVDLEFADFSDAAAPFAAAGRWLDEHAARPFDLRRKVFATALARCGPDHMLWQFNQHHIVTDFSSAGLLIDRLAKLYEAGLAGAMPMAAYPSYVDFVTRHRAFFAPPKPEVEAPAPARARLSPAVPPDRQSALAASTRMLRREIYLGPDRLAAAAAALGLKPDAAPARLHSLLYNGFAAAALVLAGRVSGQQSVTIGTPTHNRYLPGADQVAGLFIRMLPLRVEMSPGTTLAEVLRQVQAERRAVFAAAKKGEALPRRPFGVVLNHITTTMPDFAGVRSVELTDQRVAESVGLDLSITIRAADRDGDVKILFDLNEDIAEILDPDEIADVYLRIFDALFEAPDTEVARLALTGDRAQAAARQASHDAFSAPPPPYATIPQGVVAQCRKTPDAVAVSDPDASLSYRDLETRSRDAALALRGRGIGPGDFVAVACPRSVDLVVALLAVMRSGATICGIDTDTPESRAAIMLRQTGARLAITAAPARPEFAAAGVPAITLQRLQSEGAGQGHELPDIAAQATAYVMYTSGSTGTPKGILVPHGGLARYTRWAHGALADHGAIDWALSSTLSFEAAYRLFTALVGGGRVVAYPTPEAIGRVVAMDVLAADEVDAVTVTPSQLRLLVRQPKQLKRIRVLQIIGEQLSTDLAAAARAAFGDAVSIENWYGPTEATMASTRHVYDPQRDRGTTVPVGLPAPDVTVHVLDQGMNPVPRGVAGEIWLGGVRLSQGYLERPDLTSNSFLPDPFRPGGTLYRTGDLGRIDRQGALVHHGRIDSQLKVAGVRIELAEVEAAIARHPAVTGCAVVPVGAPDLRLLAYYEAAADLPAAELRALALLHLPAVAVPSAFHRLAAIPLNQNGKIDRPALARTAAEQRPEVPDAATGPAAPLSETERRLSEVWIRVLALPRVGRDDDFFEMGGDSLSVVRMVLDAEAAFGLKIPPTALDGRRTIRALAALIDEIAGTGPTGDGPIPGGDARSEAPRNRPPAKRFRRLRGAARRAITLLTRPRIQPPVPGFDAGLAPEVLAQLRTSAMGWPGTSLSDDVPCFGLNLDGGKPPLIWCFNGGHEPVELARQLGDDQPIFAFRSMSSIIGSKADRRRMAEALARRYAAEIERLLPGGPYLLGGNCQGGRIAEYLARHLLSLGHAVPQLSLLEHVPLTPYPGRVALFFGRESGRFNPFYLFEKPQIGWQRLHREVVWDIVPGDHGTYFQPSNARAFSERLAQRLAEVPHQPSGRFPVSSMAARIVATRVPEKWPPGSTRQIQVSVTNHGTTAWTPTEQSTLVLAGIWRHLDDREPIRPAGEIGFSRPVAPGESFSAALELQAPNYAGRFALEIDMCEPGIAWFCDHGSTAARTVVTVG